MFYPSSIGIPIIQIVQRDWKAFFLHFSNDANSSQSASSELKDVCAEQGHLVRKRISFGRKGRVSCNLVVWFLRSCFFLMSYVEKGCGKL